VVAVLAGLTGCSGGGDSAASPTPLGPKASTSVKLDTLPGVTGEEGKLPTITYPLKPGESSPPPSPTDPPSPTESTDPSDTASPSATPSPYLDPPTSLQVKTLKEGTGEVVKAGDVLSIAFAGWTWGSTEPLGYSTYTAGDPLVFALINEGVLVPLARATVGQKLGSRVMAVIPPSTGSLNTALGAEASQTLVAVIDIYERWPKSLQADPKATPTGAKTGPVITGALGGPATVAVPGGITPPEKVTTEVVAKGTGQVVADGDTVLYQYAAVDWTGGDGGSSWVQDVGPVSTVVQADMYGTGQVNAFSGLVGVPVGSRVLVTTPAKEKSYLAEAVVIDVVAIAKPLPGSAKATQSASPTPSP
jgi:peptidylprolyl isomerase